VAYWKLFMRATQLISRRQEYRADELACAVAGSSALMGGLRKIAGSAAAQQLYWRSQVFPALEAGCRLPIAEGFARFIASPGMAAATAAHVEKEIAGAKALAFDSHPPLRDRLAAAARFPGRPLPEASDPAVTLIDGLDALEVKLLEAIAPKAKAASLKLAQWEKIGATVYVPSWRRFVAENAHALAGFKVEDLVRLALDPKDVASRMCDPKGMLLTREQRIERARLLLWNAFALTLLDHGWELQADPGQYSLHRGEQIIKPDELSSLMRSGKMTASGWVARSRELGIGDLELVSTAASGAAAVGGPRG
jgi:heat shock protein HtpX